MIEYNEIKEGQYLVLGGEPYEVLDSHLFRKQQRQPVNVTRLKNLITGKVVEYSFHQSDRGEEAVIEEREVDYLYQHRGEYWFRSPKDKSQRFKLTGQTVVDKLRFVAPNSPVKLLIFNNQTIRLKTPIKVALKVKEAAPAVRGDTVQGGQKKAVLETGAGISVPLFIKEGDTVVVNTETGEYVSRLDEK